MKKRIFAFISVLSLLFLIACGDSGGKSNTASKNSKSSKSSDSVPIEDVEGIAFDLDNNTYEYDGLKVTVHSVGYVDNYYPELTENVLVSGKTDVNGHYFFELEIENTNDHDIEYFNRFELYDKERTDLSPGSPKDFIWSTAEYNLPVYNPEYGTDEEKEEFNEYASFLEKYKLLETYDYPIRDGSTVRGLWVMNFDEPVHESIDSIYVYNDSDLVFTMKPTDEKWKFSDVEYSVDYDKGWDDADSFQ